VKKSAVAVENSVERSQGDLVVKVKSVPVRNGVLVSFALPFDTFSVFIVGNARKVAVDACKLVFKALHGKLIRFHDSLCCWLVLVSAMIRTIYSEFLPCSFLESTRLSLICTYSNFLFLGKYWFPNCNRCKRRRVFYLVLKLF